MKGKKLEYILGQVPVPQMVFEPTLVAVRCFFHYSLEKSSVFLGQSTNYLYFCIEHWFYIIFKVFKSIMGIYINKGNEGFRRIRNSEYIDKSGLIEVINSTLFTRNCFSCITRSRRFGKTMAAEMLQAYYDHSCNYHIHREYPT